MKEIFNKLAVVIILISVSFAGMAKSDVKNSPNIVLILMDDMGYGDLGCYGAIDYTTPNIDKLASNGIRFTNFYAAAAICTASRAGLLTGCYPNRVGMHGALSPNSETGLSPKEEIIPEILKKQGYKSAAFGKWHLGDAPEFLPLQQGFDEYLGLPYSNDMWPVYYDGNRNFPEGKEGRKSKLPELPLIKNNEKIDEIKTLQDMSQLTTLYTESAVNFIHKNKNNPFFLYLAHSMPHTPLAVSDKFKGKSKQGLYGDVIMELDWSVGQVIKALKDNGLTDNTIIILTSDNGPRLNFGNNAGSTGGLNEGKATTFEGGQRVPSVMKWPGHIPEGSICNEMACAIDILPTLAKITGSALPNKKIDGVDILPLLMGEVNAVPRKSLYYYFKKNSLEAVREGSWKLIFSHVGRNYEGFEPGADGFPGKIDERYQYNEGLYDLRRDPGERYNVEEYYPEIVVKLKTLADSARVDLGDDLQGEEGHNRRDPGHISEK